MVKQSQPILSIETMTLEEKIGQLFIIRPEPLDNPNQEINDANNYRIIKFNQRMQETMKKYPVGIIIFFSKNIINPLQLTNFVHQPQTNSSIASNQTFHVKNIKI